MTPCTLSRAVRASVFAAIPALALTAAIAEVPDGPPRLSPRAEVSQVVGLSEIGITYSRPSVNGRTVFGELVPWGEVWRTGANEATQFTLSHDAEIEGQAIEAGSYALFTVPGEKRWKLIFNREAEQWGAFRYDAEKDALTFEVEPRSAPHTEAFEIAFAEVTAETAEVVLAWAETEVSFTVRFDVDAVAFEVASRFVEANPVPDRRTWNWASYFFQQGTHTEEALAWATSVREAGSEIYWTYALEARLLSRAGQAAKAVARAEAALDLAASQAEQPGVAADSEKLREELAGWKESAED